MCVDLHLCAIRRPSFKYLILADCIQNSNLYWPTRPRWVSSAYLWAPRLCSSLLFKPSACCSVFVLLFSVLSDVLPTACCSILCLLFCCFVLYLLFILCLLLCPLPTVHPLPAPLQAVPFSACCHILCLLFHPLLVVPFSTCCYILCPLLSILLTVLPSSSAFDISASATSLFRALPNVPYSACYAAMPAPHSLLIYPVSPPFPHCPPPYPPPLPTLLVLPTRPKKHKTLSRPHG